MSENQLDLITLTVSPVEARMVGTAIALRAYHLTDAGEDNMMKSYETLGYKIARQWLTQIGSI